MVETVTVILLPQQGSQELLMATLWSLKVRPEHGREMRETERNQVLGDDI